MGDRCYVTMRFHKDDFDLPMVQEFLENDLRPEYDPDKGEVSAPEVNYGAYDARMFLAKAGIRFTGNHSEGCEYGGMTFYSMDGCMYELSVDYHGDPSIVLKSNGNQPAHLDPDCIRMVNEHLHSAWETEKLIEESWKE